MSYVLFYQLIIIVLTPNHKQIHADGLCNDGDYLIPRSLYRLEKFNFHAGNLNT